MRRGLWRTRIKNEREGERRGRAGGREREGGVFSGSGLHQVDVRLAEVEVQGSARQC